MPDAAPAPADTGTDADPGGATSGDAPRAVDGPIVAITVDDSLLHVAPADEVLDHLVEEAAPESLDPQQWEFFTGDGAVLVQDTDPETGKMTLVGKATAAAPSDLDRQLILDRIDAFLARAQVKLTRELLRGQAADHRRVPRLTGDLPDVVAGLAAVMTVEVDPDPHSRNWVHNLGHRLGS